jgi:hypothetical protein
MMSGEHNKGQSRENWQRVRAVLNEHWDPLDVVELEVEDEYDFYVSAICLMLADQQVSESTIDHHLYGIGTVGMGLTPYPNFVEACKRTAAILIGLRPRFEAH